MGDGPPGPLEPDIARLKFGAMPNIIRTSTKKQSTSCNYRTQQVDAPLPSLYIDDPRQAQQQSFSPHGRTLSFIIFAPISASTLQIYSYLTAVSIPV